MMWRVLFPFVTCTSGFVCGVLITLNFFVNEESLPVARLPDNVQDLHLHLDKTSKQHEYGYVNLNRTSKQHEFDLANIESKKYLFPEYVPWREAVPLDNPALLQQEYTFRKTLFVGVMTSELYLPIRAKTVYETWGTEVSMLMFFVGEDCKVPEDLVYLPVIKLKNIPDQVYPPLEKAFAVMQYMYDHFVDEYNWFIRADDDMYLRGHKMMDLLNQMDSNAMISLGRAGEGKEEDMLRLSLLKHERYCMGGPGMIFSRGAMKGLGPYLNLCLHAIFYHDKHNPQKWDDDDVEIGRCLSRELDVQCSTSREGRKFFHYDFTGECLKPAAFWTMAEFRDMISIHAIKDADHLRSLHLFYKTLEYEHLFERHQEIQKSLISLCKNLPHELVPPSFISSSCNIDFGSFHYYKKDIVPAKQHVQRSHKHSPF